LEQLGPPLADNLNVDLFTLALVSKVVGKVFAGSEIKRKLTGQETRTSKVLNSPHVRELKEQANGALSWASRKVFGETAQPSEASVWDDRRTTSDYELIAATEQQVRAILQPLRLPPLNGQGGAYFTWRSSDRRECTLQLPPGVPFGLERSRQLRSALRQLDPAIRLTVLEMGPNR
jgi:hypothetical protein